MYVSKPSSYICDECVKDFENVSSLKAHKMEEAEKTVFPSEDLPNFR